MKLEIEGDTISELLENLFKKLSYLGVIKNCEINKENKHKVFIEKIKLEGELKQIFRDLIDFISKRGFCFVNFKINKFKKVYNKNRFVLKLELVFLKQEFLSNYSLNNLEFLKEGKTKYLILEFNEISL